MGAAAPTTASLPPLHHPVHRFRYRTIDFSREVAVMAIVNRTPDSFWDRGRTFSLDAAVTAAEAAIHAGAGWIDVGGQPFAAGTRLTARTTGRAGSCRRSTKGPCSARKSRGF